MIYSEVAKLNHTPECIWNREDSCDCGAIERHLTARVAELERKLTPNEWTSQELAAFQTAKGTANQFHALLKA